MVLGRAGFGQQYRLAAHRPAHRARVKDAHRPLGAGLGSRRSGARKRARVPRVLAIDAGGTMTDTFIVDEHGAFVVGKAQTTPEDESLGFMASARDALAQWGSTPSEGFPPIVSGIYSGTAMLNRLLQRQGLRVGCIVNAGHEDYLRLERGIQTYLGYLLLRPPAPRDALPQRAARAARADEGRARAHRRVRRRGAAAARAGRARGRRASCSTRRRGDRRLAAVLLPQPRARAARRRRSSREEKARAASTARSRCSSPASCTRCAAICRG